MKSTTTKQTVLSDVHVCFRQLLHIALLGEAQDRHYAVPSAGALYPYELDLVLRTTQRAEAWHGLTLAALASILPEISRDICSVSLTLWLCPGRTVRKYGERGIIYSMQDCGHVIASLALAARHMGLSCKHTPAAFDGLGYLPERVAVAQLEINTTDGPSALSDVVRNNAQVLDAMLSRRSADSFDRSVTPPDLLHGVLTKAEALFRDCAFGTLPFGFHLAWRDSIGGWRLAGAEALTDLLSVPAKPTGFEPVPMFCMQEFTAGAGAMLMISAAVGSRAEALQQSLALGQLGQCLYIAAEIHRCAACCVGGFDYAAAWRFLVD